jgi:hypothetical protein
MRGLTLVSLLLFSTAGAAHEVPPFSLEVEGSKLRVEIGEDPPVSRLAIHRWVERSSAMVVNYFGRFPVDDLKVEIVTGGARSLGWGQHFRGRRLEIHAGRRTTTGDIERDWVMVHEMMHCAFPWLERRHRWMREGLSTYLESVVRAEAGVLTADDVWERWLDRMHNGLPDPGDRGYDFSRSWGTTYWGGALYWLLADIEIREATANKHSLKTALRAILAEGGSSRKQQPVEKVLAIGDKATGTTVLQDLYANMARKRGDVDLPALWAELGVSEAGGQVRYDKGAKLAAVRAAMYRPVHALPALPSH